MPNNDRQAHLADGPDVRAKLADWNRSQIQKILSDGKGPFHVQRLLNQADEKAVTRMVHENKEKPYEKQTCALVLCYNSTHGLLRQLAPDLKRPEDLQHKLEEFDKAQADSSLAANVSRPDDR